MPRSVDELNWVGHSLAGGRYQVTALLGEGGMGSVYRARDANLDAEVVIKVPKPALLADREFAARFGREVRSLVRLAHAHIVRVLDVGEHERLPFAVMQFLPGGSLRERAAAWTEPRLALAALGSWLADVADALDYVHSQGYVHRDVKPDNVLFDAAGRVYLGDFGIAKALATSGAAAAGPDATFQTTAGLVVGTPQYMAPELIGGAACDGRVDQYALAVTVYEVVCGRLPFNGPTPAALVVEHATRKPPPPHEVSAAVPLAFSTALLRGLSKDPARRFPDCRSLARALLAPPQATVAPAASPPTTRSTPRPLPAPVPSPVPRPAGVGEYPCPSCGTVFRLPPSPEGKRLRCRHCGKDFKVPAILPAAPPPGQVETQVVPASRTPKPKPARPARKADAHGNAGEATSTRLWPRGALAGLLGCALLVLMLVVGVWAWRRQLETAGGGPSSPPTDLSSNGIQELKLVSVSGKVILHGKPISGGQVILVPTGDAAKVDAKGSLSVGQIDSNGQYKIFTGGKEGAPLGQYKVTVSSSIVPAPFNSQYLDAGRTPLTIEVVDNPAPGTYDLKLTP